MPGLQRVEDLIQRELGEPSTKAWAHVAAAVQEHEVSLMRCEMHTEDIGVCSHGNDAYGCKEEKDGE